MLDLDLIGTLINMRLVWQSNLFEIDENIIELFQLDVLINRLFGTSIQSVKAKLSLCESYTSKVTSL